MAFTKIPEDFVMSRHFSLKGAIGCLKLVGTRHTATCLVAGHYLVAALQQMYVG
jgi:hypothetical protein